MKQNKTIQPRPQSRQFIFKRINLNWYMYSVFAETNGQYMKMHYRYEKPMGLCEEYKSYDINFRLGNWVLCQSDLTYYIKMWHL